jgi:uncharacterized protein (TIGR03435 family)
MEPQVVGPDWLDTNRFDIVAKSPEGVPDSELPSMLQMLLKERFNLAAHLESRVMPVYHLVVSRSGVKMPIYPARSSLENDPSVRGFPMIAGAGSVSRLASQMAFVIGTPVIDKTELKERYSYFLSFAPLAAQPDRQSPDFGPPDIFTAVEKQLGLKLQPAKDDVRVVIVDQIEKMPTGN